MLYIAIAKLHIAACEYDITYAKRPRVQTIQSIQKATYNAFACELFYISSDFHGPCI